MFFVAALEGALIQASLDQEKKEVPSLGELTEKILPDFCPPLYSMINLKYPADQIGTGIGFPPGESQCLQFKAVCVINNILKPIGLHKTEQPLYLIQAENVLDIFMGQNYT